MTFSIFFFFFITLFHLSPISHQQPFLTSHEQHSVYQILDSINAAVPWRTFFPDDLCSSAPHGIVCDNFSDGSVHITELNFGYISDFTANPSCSSNSTINPLLLYSSAFKYLRKLFFYKCFAGNLTVSLPGDISQSPVIFQSSLEELVLIDNPSLVGSLTNFIANFTNLKRIVVTGNGVYGDIPFRVSDFVHLEEMTLSRNRLSGEIPARISELKNLKILDLSRNYFDGKVPESMGGLSELLKLDLSRNRFSGKIPESFGDLKEMEYLDLSFNRFGNFGIPNFILMMPKLKEVYLSGNLLGGEIPGNWEKVKGILGIGFSGMGLTGRIPSSMGLYLRNLNYLSLDNNKLEGSVPEEFGFLENLKEMNFENNSLSGKLPFSADFSAKIGPKLRLGGNPKLCVDEGLKLVKNGSILGQLRLCHQPNIITSLALNGCSSIKFASTCHLLLLLGVLWIFWVKF